MAASWFGTDGRWRVFIKGGSLGSGGFGPIAKQPCQHIFMCICIQKEKNTHKGSQTNQPELIRTTTTSLSLHSDERVVRVAASPVEFPVYTPAKGPGRPAGERQLYEWRVKCVCSAQRRQAVKEKNKTPCRPLA